MLQDVNAGVLDEAFFPVENTTTEIIARTYDYFQYYNVYAVGEVVEPIVQNSNSNMTRFLVITNRPDYPENANKVSIYFVTRHSPAALYNALGVFASLGIEVLRKL